jgi:DeoR family transcriptional regulator, fructose operon transcriptional repressor
VELRCREIARCAAQEVKPGEVILIDSGPIAAYLAEHLQDHRDITVISNASDVLRALSECPAITLISTGGAYSRPRRTLVGPIAETALRNLRADKLFLMGDGVSLGFGLSHAGVTEVSAKQTMINSAREVIMLADHTCFGQDSMVHVAPATNVHRLITDDALPASWRLELGKLGIHVTLAGA